MLDMKGGGAQADLNSLRGADEWVGDWRAALGAGSPVLHLLSNRT